MISALLNQLSKVKQTGQGEWIACCPAHDDSDPSLSITEQEEGRILIHCFAGCSPAEIMASVGLTMADLFSEDTRSTYTKSLLPKAHRKAEEVFKDRVYLQIAFEKRSRGERLTPQELSLEKEAFMRVRRSHA